MSKVVIGLSGGVDSSVAAYLLKKSGYEVTACFMRSFDTDRSAKECEEARRLAELLSIDFKIIDERENFKREVIELFMSEYLSGRTPNPCCICNRTVKWQALLSCMRECDADYVATGHYAEVVRLSENGRYCIKRAAHLKKDQSYALYNLTQEELSHTIMPLHSYTKDEVREIAKEAGLFTAEKPDSQEICFIPDGDYVSFIKAHEELMPTKLRERFLSGEFFKRGDLIDSDGRVLGEHQGIEHFTIGQRKGFGVGFGKRMFVKELRRDTNEVVLSENEELFTKKLSINKVNLQGADGNKSCFHALCKIRYGDKGSRALVELRNEGLCADIYFDDPVRAATPGQAAVFYDEEGHLLGGGTICI